MSFDLENAKLQVRNFIEKHSTVNHYLVEASEKTKVEKEFIFVGAIAVLFLLIFALTGGDVVIDLIGFGYPFYMSLKAIETETVDDDKQWLTYWIVFVFFKLVENIADVLISFIPFYFFFKVGFLVWASHPSFKGATLIYDLIFKSYIVPALGIRVKSQKRKAPEEASYLEVYIDNLVRNNSAEVVEEDDEGLFVEVAAFPPPGELRSSGTSGIEGTFFKTQVALGDEKIFFQHMITISPLPNSDGFLQVVVKEKHTYGDDVILGQRDDLPVACFPRHSHAEAAGKVGGNLVVPVGPYDVTMTARYVHG